MAGLLNLIINLITVAVFARVILSFVLPLMGARPHPLVVNANTLVNQVTEPLLGPLRRVLPSFGGFDFSPMALLIILWLIRTRIVDAL